MFKNLIINPYTIPSISIQYPEEGSEKIGILDAGCCLKATVQVDTLEMRMVYVSDSLTILRADASTEPKIGVKIVGIQNRPVKLTA